MRFSDTTGRSVTSVADATTLGTVTGFVVDPGPPRLAGLRIRKPGGGSFVLPWASVRGIGPDAVMAQPGEAGKAAEAELGHLADKRYELLGKRVLNELGDELGPVEDVDYDPESGVLLSVTTQEGDIDGRRVAGLGSYALVVRAA